MGGGEAVLKGRRGEGEERGRGGEKWTSEEEDSEEEWSGGRQELGE